MEKENSQWQTGEQNQKKFWTSRMYNNVLVHQLSFHQTFCKQSLFFLLFCTFSFSTFLCYFVFVLLYLFYMLLFFLHASFLLGFNQKLKR